MPRYGTEKLHLGLRESLESHHIKMGRDKFLKFCRQHRLLVRRTKRGFITTDSKHFYHKSPNLVKDVVVSHSEQVFVSDITYIRLANGFAYLALVTDLYSKQIMGYKLESNMKVGMVKDALKMAIKNRVYAHPNVIHHSDRGIQYCCPDYSEFAVANGMILSTTEKYDPYENAVAERVNGILKYEFGLNKTIPSLEVAQKMVARSVEVYNHKRKHRSLEMQTPAYAHTNQAHVYRSYRKKDRNVDKV